MKKNLLLFGLLFMVTFANAQLSGYYKQNFESASFPPSGWLTINRAGSNVWLPSRTVAHSGIKSAFSSYSYPDPKGVNYLVAPKFTVAAGDSVTFWFTPQFTGFPDTLYVQVSTSNTNATSFTTTLATFYDGSNYPAAGTWVRASADLSAFAGQKVYVAFKHVDLDGDGVYVDDVALGTPPSKDITAVSIDVPPIIQTATAILPKVTFQNIGSQTQTFDVTLTSGSYTSTKTITALPPLSTQQVTFDDYTSPSVQGNISLTAYSSLAGDDNTKNDTVHSTANVLNYFVNKGWIISNDLPEPLFGNAITTYFRGTSPDDSAYIFSIGGSNDLSEILGSNYKFNVKTKTWTALSPMPLPRYGGSTFTYNGKIYYVGGYTDFFVPTYHVSVYDIATDSWSEGSPLPVSVGDYGSCQYHDSLYYVIGGFNGASDLSTVYLFNAAAGTWSTAYSYPGIPVDGGRAGIINNTIVTVGGYSQAGQELHSQAFIGVIDSTNPKKIKWTQIANYPAGPTSRLGASSLEDPEVTTVYFTGGFDNVDASIGKKDTWGYDVNAGVWLKGPDKPTGVSNISDFSPFVYKDTLYMASIGGYDGLETVSANEWLEIGAVNTVLAVHLVDLSAVLQNNKTVLNWKASEDGTNSYYIIQRSPEAIHFADISGKINSGNTSAVRSYQGYDPLPLKGYNYYRIKIVNFDGSVNYSGIKAVNNTSSAIGYALNIYPNPTHGLLNIMLQNNSGTDKMIGIAITDVAGRKISNENKTLSGSLNLSYTLKPGTYIVNLLTKDGTWKQDQKVIVE